MDVRWAVRRHFECPMCLPAYEKKELKFQISLRKWIMVWSRFEVHKVNFSMSCQCDRCSIFIPLNSRSTVATITSRLIDFKVNLIVKRNQQLLIKATQNIRVIWNVYFPFWASDSLEKEEKSWFCVLRLKTQKL